MAQFTVCRNKNPQTRSAVPFLLDVQNGLLADLETRVVVPLCPLSLAGIPKSELGVPVTRVEQYRFEIIAAIDFLLTGI